MAKAASSSGPINTKSGRALLTGRGGSVRAEGSITSQRDNAGPAGSGGVRINGRMGVGETSRGDLGFQDGGMAPPIGPNSYAGGTSQDNIDPRKRGKVR